MYGIPRSSVSHIILAVLDLKCLRKRRTQAVRIRVDQIKPGYLTATCQRATENLHGRRSGLHLVYRQDVFYGGDSNKSAQMTVCRLCVPTTANRRRSRLNVCCTTLNWSLIVVMSVNVLGSRISFSLIRRLKIDGSYYRGMPLP